MGQTLEKACKWTSAKEGMRGKLEYTPVNENILNKIIQFTEDLPNKYQAESELTFKQPLEWETSLGKDELGAGFSDGVSEKKDKNNQAFCTWKSKDGAKIISVCSFEYLGKILSAAGADRKMAETRACLESNRDPVTNMLGDRFATVDSADSSTYRYIKEIVGNKEEEGENDDKMGVLNLLLMMQDLDKQLMQQTLSSVSADIRLTADMVDHQVSVIKDSSGSNDQQHVLRSIGYVPSFQQPFHNGCRAHPRRQMHGDICYIVAKPHDGDKIYITASTHGYYVNKFTSNDVDKGEELDYGKEGEFYNDLIEILREKSATFNELIDKQEFFQLKQEEKEAAYAEQQETGGTDDDYRDEKKDNRQDNKQQDKKKKEAEKKKKLEPSLKWKNLGMDEEKNEPDEKDRKSPRRNRKGKSGQRKESNTQQGEDSFEESSSESEEEEETPDRRNETNSDLPSEYWQIQKLVKYLKGGNQTSTIIALCAMRDFNLSQETCQLAIRDVGGLEVLINLLDTEEIKCKIGALKILKEISSNAQIRRTIADLGGLQTMVKILHDPNNHPNNRAMSSNVSMANHPKKELRCLAAETIANVAKFRRARRTVRQHGGIKKLVGLLDCAPIGSVTSKESELDVEVARCGALALWSCSKSTKNKEAMRKAGAIPLLARLLKSPHENMLIPVVGTLQECATESTYRLAIRTEGMIEDLVKNLKSENSELQMHCASAIFKCAEEQETRDLVRKFGGLDPLAALLQKGDDKPLLAAATGAIWKCSISRENVQRFQQLKTIDNLVTLLNDQPEEVLVNVVGALAELAQDSPNRLTIRKAGGIPPLVNLLTGTNQALLVNVTKAVGQCAEESENMIVIDKLDGVRLLWSLLKNPNPDVQASAAWAICPCIENAKDAGEMVRSFVGGLELIVSLLKSDHKEVLASVCAAIANIANDEENLAVITDHGVVPMLSGLTNTQDDKLRQHLAEAIARCCSWGKNRTTFGTENAVAPLVRYLKSSDEVVHRSTARALYQLSKDPDNCITMHEAGVVKPLMDMVGSPDDVLQEASAGCIANIRRLALANEKAKNK